MGAFLFFVGVVSLAVAEDMPSDPNRISLLFAASEFSLDPAIHSKFFFEDYRPDKIRFIDIRDFCSRKCVMSVAMISWVGAAIESYRGDGKFRLRSRVKQEPTVSASFEVSDGQRAIFIPRRSMPRIVFPLENGNSLLAVHITGNGIALTYARTFGPPRPKRH
ncbi:MAG: hypothetical protein AAB652_01515 [Patescibacteria group bacterium]